MTFTDPELAQVGHTEATAQAAGLDFEILRWSFAENDRAQAERETDGFVKVIITPKGRVLARRSLARMLGAYSNLGLGHHAEDQDWGHRIDDRALSDTGRGQQAGRRQLVYAKAVQRADPEDRSIPAQVELR